jgi:hypothetical protein
VVETFDDSERARRAGLRSDESAESRPVKPGMVVAGADGGNVGRVKEVRRTDFLVSRRLAVDLYVPYGACQAMDGDRVILKVPAGDVGDQGWASPTTADSL